MGYFSKQIKDYLLYASPEQLAEDQVLLNKYADVGSSVYEYFNELGYPSEIWVTNEIASPEFDALDFSFCA